MSSRARTGIRGQPADGVAGDEQSHFTICPGRGARVDMRNLDDVLRHTHGEEIPCPTRHS